MKPSARLVLDQLRQGPQTTHSLLAAGCGSRFGARVAELRALGYRVDVERLRQGSCRYTLVSEPETGRPLSEAENPTKREQASPGFVPSQEGVRLAAPAESLFDTAAFARRGDWRDVA